MTIYPQRFKAIAYRKCKLCKQAFTGRPDKIFCSVHCKSHYHYQLQKLTNKASFKVDKILHRNRSILHEILGPNHSQKMIPKSLLDQKKFHFHYFTHHYVDPNALTLYFIYDFSYTISNDLQVVITRIKIKPI